MFTVLSNTQFAINNRPLTYQSSDQLDVLTPNLLLKVHGGRELHLDTEREELLTIN